MSDWYFEGEELGFAGREPAVLEFENKSVVAIANILAAGLMEILGPYLLGNIDLAVYVRGIHIPLIGPDPTELHFGFHRFSACTQNQR